MVKTLKTIFQLYRGGLDPIMYRVHHVSARSEHYQRKFMKICNMWNIIF